jgi:hypothetical protein
MLNSEHLCISRKNVKVTVLWDASPFSLEESYQQTNKQTNSMVRVRERTIPTERPPLVGEVIANFCG